MNFALLDKPVVLKQLGDCSNTQLYRDIAAGTMTPGIRLGRRKVAWPSGEIEMICRAKISGMSVEERRDLVRNLLAQRVALRPAMQVPSVSQMTAP